MAENFLKLNDGKTEIMEIHGYQPLAQVQKTFQLIEDGKVEIEPTLTAKNLGFYFDSKMCLDEQLNQVSQKCYMNLRNIGRIGSKLTTDLKTQLVHSCVHSIIDFANATYSGLNRDIYGSAVFTVFAVYISVKILIGLSSGQHGVIRAI